MNIVDWIKSDGKLTLSRAFPLLFIHCISSNNVDVAELILVCGGGKEIYLCLDCCYTQTEVVPYRKTKNREQRRKTAQVILLSSL